MEKKEEVEPGMFFFGDSGSRYFGQTYETEAQLQQHLVVKEPITFLNVMQVTTFHIPIPPTPEEIMKAKAEGVKPNQQIQRRTLFTNIDMAPGPLPKFTMLPTYVYPLEQDGDVGRTMKAAVRAELKDMQEREIHSRLQRSGLHGV